MKAEGFISAEDTMEIALYVEWDPSSFVTLARGLDAMRDKAKRLEKGAAAEAPPSDVPASFVPRHPYSDFPAQLMSSGVRMGGSGGPVYRWHLRWPDGWSLAVMNRAEVHDTMPNAFLRVGAEPLTRYRTFGVLWAELNRWFASMGARVVRAVPSRIDVAVDMPGVEVDRLYRAFQDRRYVTRAKSDVAYGEDVPLEVHRSGRKTTGFRIGRAPMLRVYDKLEETRNNPEKRALMVGCRWGGVVPEAATRVEFQLRREWLTRDGDKPVIDTIEDWMKHAAAVVEYLTTRWVRFVEEAYDPRHTERAREWSLWSMIRAAFRAGVYSPERDDSRPPMVRAAVNVGTLLRQARGVFERVAAMLRVPVESADDFLDMALHKLIEVSEGDASIPARVRAKLVT